MRYLPTNWRRLFQSSSYWIRAGSDAKELVEKAKEFQSSSYWIRAGSDLVEIELKGQVLGSFNPHLTGYGLEVIIFQRKSNTNDLSFNPHLTGYGLEVNKHSVRNICRVFQSSSYWIRAGSPIQCFAERPPPCFNPHLTGYGLEVTRCNW